MGGRKDGMKGKGRGRREERDILLRRGEGKGRGGLARPLNLKKPNFARESDALQTTTPSKLLLPSHTKRPILDHWIFQLTDSL